MRPSFTTMVYALEKAAKAIKEELAAAGNDIDHPVLQEYKKVLQQIESIIRRARGEP